ncbi:MAG: class I SAM-dependent methyltransferase [Lentisphaerae bacterium]|nr:class I SAM-dependent methyltransferase [Lentisphaerota bacterium]
MQRLIAWAESGRLPDTAVRWGIRRLLARRLADPETQPEALQRFLDTLRRSPVAVMAEKANAQHYELPPEFFERVLGPRLKYSACLWTDGVRDLPAAEDAMLALTCERAELADGMNILELGCGWGSLTLWMAERYPRARIRAVSNSRPQRAFIEAQCRARGLENVTVETADMNRFEPEGPFDRIVSVEMFEHMRNWEALLARLRGGLADDGRVFIHVFCHREYAYFFEAEQADDWMARYFFSGGLMPCEHLPLYLQRDLLVERHWRVGGVHYAKTLRAWLDRLDAQRDAVAALMRETYGAAAGARWLQRWRMFFMACEELFACRGGREWYVGHYRLAPRGGAARAGGGAR